MEQGLMPTGLARLPIKAEWEKADHIIKKGYSKQEVMSGKSYAETTQIVFRYLDS